MEKVTVIGFKNLLNLEDKRHTDEKCSFAP